MNLDSPVSLQHDEPGVAVVTVERAAAMNTFDVATARALRQAFEQLAADGSVRAVVLRGAGKAFGAGGDVNALGSTPESIPQLIEHMHAAVTAIAALDAPVIASVHGVAAGASLSVVAACDLAIAAEGTRFNLAFAKLGASCDTSSSWSLPRLVGLKRAMEIALLCETFDAAEAQRMGLVNRVVPAERLEAETLAIARTLASGPTQAYGRIKGLMWHSLERSLAEQLDAEREAFVASSQTADFAEGVSAFLAKRTPVFRGR